MTKVLARALSAASPIFTARDENTRRVLTMGGCILYSAGMGVLWMILFVFAFVAIFGIFLVCVSAAIGPKPQKSAHPRGDELAVQQEAYECGIKEQVARSARVPIKFYLTAILFILFDIEIIFMYPWAIAFLDFINDGHGLPILLAMALFLAIFVFGLVWEIKSKALEWD